jgi:hypothetical protein
MPVGQPWGNSGAACCSCLSQDSACGRERAAGIAGAQVVSMMTSWTDICPCSSQWACGTWSRLSSHLWHPVCNAHPSAAFSKLARMLAIWWRAAIDNAVSKCLSAHCPFPDASACPLVRVLHHAEQPESLQDACGCNSTACAGALSQQHRPAFPRIRSRHLRNAVQQHLHCT